MDALEAQLGACNISKFFIICIDTEGSSRTGIREVAAMSIDDTDVSFYDTVTPLQSTAGLAPQDADHTWASVGPRFFAWVAQITPKNRTALLVGHNVIKHDVPLLKKETLAQCPDAMPKLMLWCDTLAAVRSVMLDLKKRDQRSVYAHIYGAPPLAHGTHTAFGDARTNAAIARDGMTPNVVAENILRDSLEPRLPRAEMDERTRRRMQWESKKAVINLKRKR